MDKSSENKLYSGLLIYRLQRNVEYLLLNDSFTNKKHWFFPEGEVKGNEDEINCVLRETFDLTGLKPQDLHVESFKIQYKYLVGTAVKKVNIHVAQIIDSHMRLLPNADGIHFMWCNRTVAIEKITTRSIDVVFKNVQEMVEQKVKTHPPQTRRPRVSTDDHRPRTTAARPEQQRPDGLVTHQRSSPQPQRRQTQSNDNPLYKTRLCERFEKDGTCSYGAKCNFAHGLTELRERLRDEEDHPRPVNHHVVTAPSAVSKNAEANPLYKTKLCDRFEKENFCQYGPKCHFAHGMKELKERPAYNYNENEHGRRSEEEYQRPNKDRQQRYNRQQYGEAADSVWQPRALNDENKRDGADGKSPNQNGRSTHVTPWTHKSSKAGSPSSISSNSNSSINDDGGSTNEASKNTDGWPNTNGWPKNNISLAANPSDTINPKSDKQKPALAAANKVSSVPAPEPKPVPGAERKPVTTTDSDSGGDSSDSQSLGSERTNTPSQEVNGSIEETNKSWMKLLVLSKEDQKKMDISSPATSPSPGPNKANPEDALINELRNVFKEYPDKDGVKTGTMRPDVKAVTRMEMRNDLPKRQLLFIILASMFDEKDCRVTTKIEARLPLFTTFVKNETDERMLLKAWEKLVTDRMPTLLSRTNHMCSAFYQHDILSEEVFEAWHKSLGEDNKVKRSAEKFREWLMSEDD